MTIRSSRRLLLLAAAISALGACNNQITTEEVINELEREAFRGDGPAFPAVVAGSNVSWKGAPAVAIWIQPVWDLNSETSGCERRRMLPSASVA